MTEQQQTPQKPHKRVMIAVDPSIDSEYAFNEAIKTLDKENDYLYIISVSPTIINFPVSGISATLMVDAQREADRKVHTLLVHYVNICKRHGIKNFKTFLGTGSHAGEVICRAAEEKLIDVLFLGRRGLSRIKRLFIGSTSRYCVEHAPCTVVCVKLPPNMETLPDHNVNIPDEVHKESAETFDRSSSSSSSSSPAPSSSSAPSTSSSQDPAHRLSVGAIPPLVERYSHPV